MPTDIQSTNYIVTDVPNSGSQVLYYGFRDCDLIFFKSRNDKRVIFKKPKTFDHPNHLETHLLSVDYANHKYGVNIFLNVYTCITSCMHTHTYAHTHDAVGCVFALCAECNKRFHIYKANDDDGFYTLNEWTHTALIPQTPQSVNKPATVTYDSTLQLYHTHTHITYDDDDGTYSARERA